MSSSQTCIRCHKPGNLRCGRCRAVLYCSAECQKQHWISGHKGECQILASNAPKQYIKDEKTESSPKTSSKAVTKSDENKPKEGPKVLSLETNEFLFPTKRVQQSMQCDLAFALGRQNDLVGVGLHNVGNSCYLNSVLQCFTYTEPLVMYCLSKEHSTNCKLSKEDKFCLFCLLEEHIDWALKAAQAFFPREIYINIMKIGDYRYFEQEDAHDFTYAVLNKLQESFLTNANAPKNNPTIEETSLIYQLFGGYIKSQLKCVICEHSYYNYESFLDLSLELKSGVKSLEEALQTFTDIESIPVDVGWRCQQCGRVSAAQKQLTVHTPPNILILTLKRFDLMRGGYKNDTPIVFRDTLNLSKILSSNATTTEADYNLYAVIVHFGNSIFGGHYVAFVKVDEQWFLFDDARVVEVNLAVVLKQSAYMLFYKKTSKQANPKTSHGKSTRGYNPNPDIMPKISSQSEATTSMNDTATNANSTALETPHHYVFYRENSEGFIQDLVLKIKVPMMVTADDTSIEVTTDGKLFFLTKKQYELQIQIPFTFQVTKCTADFFPLESVVVVILPVAANPNETQSHQVPITTQKTTESLLAINQTLDENNEVSVTPIERKKASKTTTESKATYSDLYETLANTSISENNSARSALTGSGGVKKEAVPKPKRNDDCPCGSGKKYKKCHGK